MPEEAPPQEKPKGFRRLLAKLGSSAGTVVAVIASGVALVFTLKPSLAPDPGAGLVGTVGVQAIEPGVSLPEWDKRYAPAQVAADAGGGDGALLYVNVAIEGQKHGHVDLYTVRYQWSPRTPLDDHYPLVSATGFDPGTPNDKWVAPVWVAAPNVDYMVRVLLEHDGVILAFADTGRIKGTRG